MSNSALKPASTVTPETESRDPVAEALRLIEQTNAAIVKVRAQVDASVRMLTELGKISAVFDSVGDRLVNATFKASGEATRGVSSHAVLLSFVEELGDLARLALAGARDVRREVRSGTSNATPPVGVFHETDAALQELATTLRRIALRAARPVASHPIEIENRASSSPPPLPAAARVQSALDRAMTAGIFAPGGSKTGGYKN